MDTQFKAVHADLRKIASAVMRQERLEHTLETDALLSELYIRICNSGLPVWADDEDAYVRWCRLLIKRMLMDHGRARGRLRRGGHLRRASPAALDALSAPSAPRDAHALRRSVQEILEQGVRDGDIDNRHAAALTLHTSFQLSAREISEQLQMPLRTVQHVLAMTRAYVAAELERRSE